MRFFLACLLAVMSVGTVTQAQVYLYEDCNYKGERIVLWEGYNSLNDLVNKGMPNDAVSSVWIDGDYRVILYEGYRLPGNNREVTSSTRCLHGFNDVVSSAQVFATNAAGLARDANTENAVNFMIGADPQFGYPGRSVRRNRTIPTMLETAQVVKACTDCVQMLVVAGDLVQDNTDQEDTYGDVHRQIEANGVKVFDGLGNHDNNNFADDWVSFDSLAGLYHIGSLDSADRSAAIDEGDIVRNALSQHAGWLIHHHKLSKIDDGITGTFVPFRTGGEYDEDRGRVGGTACASFRYADAYYCKNKAYYYSVSLYPVAAMRNGNFPSEPAAFMVQLHNAMRSTTAVDFLKEFGDKIRAANQAHIPVIIVGHQMESNSFSGSPLGLSKSDFDAEVARLNVAAILMGHYGCVDRGDKDNGHCDYQNTIPDVTRFGTAVTNVHGHNVVRINTSSFFHNMFWMVSLSPEEGKIAFRSINRGAISDVDTLSGSLNNIGQQMDLSIGGRAQPILNQTWWICPYKTSANCSAGEKTW